MPLKLTQDKICFSFKLSYLTVILSSFLVEKGLEDIREKFEEKGAALKMYGIVNISLLQLQTSSKQKQKSKKNKIQIQNRSSMKMLMKWKPN